MDCTLFADLVGRAGTKIEEKRYSMKVSSMPNRVIKDSIWSSPTLAKLPLDTQLHWPRWLLMADDWGCFNADPDVIKGLLYPKVPTITIRKICDLMKSYTEAGLIFLWEAGDRAWGLFTSWHGHQFCNATHLDEDGKQLRHKRKTPEPPGNELLAYLEQHKLINQVVGEKLEQVRAVQNKYRNPNPNPNPKKEYGEFQNVRLTDNEFTKLEQRFGKDDALRRIENLSQYIASKGKKYTSHYATILQWAARDEKNGKTAQTIPSDPYADNPMGIYADWPSPPAEDFCIHGWGLTAELRVKHGDRADHECGQCQADARKAAEKVATV